MLWKTKKQAEPRQLQKTFSTEMDVSEKALDMLADLLRIYGKFALDTETVKSEIVRAQCNDWARKILVGAAKTTEDTNDQDISTGLLQRDWPGLRQFFSNTRKQEIAAFQASLGNLRQTIETFAKFASSAIAEDRRSDNAIAQKLDALSIAIQDGDTHRIRYKALDIVDVVHQSIQSRRQRDANQVKVLGQKLREMSIKFHEARQKAEVDQLTQLYNRASFDTRIQRLVELNALFDQSPCLLLVDIDHFKAINDSYGHPAGDVALKSVADTLMRTFIRKQDLVCRYGGEEFGILLTETDAKSALGLADRLLDAVRKLRIAYHEQELQVTVSIGIALLQIGENHSTWLKRADQALYKAKHQGRDQTVIAD